MIPEGPIKVADHLCKSSFKGPALAPSGGSLVKSLSSFNILLNRY